jgi:hypothetical protein
MVLAIEACLGSAFLLAILILLSTNVDSPTKTGIMRGLGSGDPRLSQRKLSFTGIAESTNGKEEYNFGPSPIKASGVVASVSLIAKNIPIKIGNCSAKGPRHPKGLIPCVL